MKLLLDTHILLWTLGNDAKLSRYARELISNPQNDIYYSIISPWEITIKHMAHPEDFKTSGIELIRFCDETGFRMISIKREHIVMLEGLKREENAPIHKDPFDRILLAQAKADEMAFITHDGLMSFYNEPCIIKV